MAEIGEIVSRVEVELQRYSLALTNEFRTAAEAAQFRLTTEEVEIWADTGVAIAGNSFRSWEAATEYFRASPTVAQKLDFASLMDWAEVGRDLSGLSSSIASAFFRSSPDSLGLISATEIPAWVDMGKCLYKDTWKSGQLCGQFFDASPALFRHLTFTDLGRFVDFLDALSGLSSDGAVDCLLFAQATFALLDRRDNEPFLELAGIISDRDEKIAKIYFRDAPRALALVAPQDRPLFFAMVRDVARSSREKALSFFLEAPTHLREVDRELQGETLRLAEKVLKLSSAAASDFLKNCPTLLKRLNLAELREWVDLGVAVLEHNPEAGLAFFSLNSHRASVAMRRVSRGVELVEVRDVLRVYGKALTARNVSLMPAQDLVEKGIGWISAEQPTTEGTAIFLPTYFDEFETKARNYEAYKVLVTHQAAHLEFGTFEFSFDKPSALFDNLRAEIEAELAESKTTLSDFERFFDLFKDRRLARDVFTVLEDARVDARVGSEYRGIRAGYNRLQQRSLAKRPSIFSLPLRQGVLEYLVQVSLDDSLAASVPSFFAEQFSMAGALLKRLQNAEATVEDAAEATVRAYNILRSVPNLFLFKGQQQTQLPTEPGEEFWTMSSRDFVSTEAKIKDGEGLYTSPDAVDYRGELKPELVQTMMKMQQDGDKSGVHHESFAISPDLLRELLLKSEDIDIIDLVEGDIDSSAGLFISNLEKEHGRLVAAKAAKRQSGKASKKGVDEYEEMSEDEDEGVSYFYDEWDFRANDYRPQWCRVKEHVMQEGQVDFFDDTLRELSGLANDVRRQFERLKPEQFKKLKRLQDGEEFDLDQVVQSVVEKRAGQSPSDKVYWRKNKMERDIAVVLLLDMSASTDEEIDDPEVSSALPDWWDDDMIIRGSGMNMWSQMPERKRGKRIIDVEKESIVLLIKALEAIGDRYGIYGFSGYGRDDVEFYVVKDLKESFNDRIKRRIDKISPIRGTRMGPAIRHCISKLEETDARLRLLILLSDGRPQDHDYGKDRTEKEYAIHDTRMALLEAKRKNIVPFCLTVDKAGQDYLKTMTVDMGYEVVRDIESLPKHLTSLYKRLTT